MSASLYDDAEREIGRAVLHFEPRKRAPGAAQVVPAARALEGVSPRD